MYFHHCKTLHFYTHTFVIVVIHLCEFSLSLRLDTLLHTFSTNAFDCVCFIINVWIHIVGLNHMFLSLYKMWLKNWSIAKEEISRNVSNMRNFKPCKLSPKNHFFMSRNVYSTNHKKFSNFGHNKRHTDLKHANSVSGINLNNQLFNVFTMV
jgi:hypothetical protein